MTVPLLPPPTGKELRDVWMEEAEDQEAIVEVHEETGPDDYGYSWTRTFHRRADDTYWSVHGRNQNDGDYDTLRDDGDTITVSRVWPHQVTVTQYKTRPPKV